MARPASSARRILERSNVIVRDVESWESDFLAIKMERYQALSKRYPKELVDMWTISDRVLEKSSSGADASAAAAASVEASPDAAKKQTAPTKAKAKSSDAGSVAAPEDTAPVTQTSKQAPKAAAKGAEKPLALSSFYESTSILDAASGSEAAAAFTTAPRISSADKINDLRSLDRAYSQRLVRAFHPDPPSESSGLLCVPSNSHMHPTVSPPPPPAHLPLSNNPQVLVVRNKETGVWGPPVGRRRADEPLVQAAERSIKSAFGDPYLDVWFLGNAPIGHQLVPYAPAIAAERGCYGERIFYYRAEILAGRFRLPSGASGDPRDASTFPYDDFQWLTRDETETVLPRPLFKYLHQIIGAGAGEEFVRNSAWRERVGARALTIAQATGRRRHRVETVRLAGGRIPVLATAAQVELATAKFSDAKVKALAAEADEYHARRREQAERSRALRAALAIRPGVEAIRVKLEESRKARGGAGAAATTSSA